MASIPPLVQSMDTVPETEVKVASGTTMQVLIGPDQGAPNFVTRRFSLAPGGRIPEHRHRDIEHEQVVLEGEITLSLDGRQHRAKAGDVVLIPAGVAHSYANEGQKPARFLCIIPITDGYETEWLE